MISEGSCDWSNDAKNSALKSGIIDILKYILIENFWKLKKKVYFFYCFCCTLDQISARLVSSRDFFKKNRVCLVTKCMNNVI